MDLVFVTTWATPQTWEADRTLEKLIQGMNSALAREGLLARATLNTVNIPPDANNPDESWTNVEIWANGAYRDDNFYRQVYDAAVDAMYGTVPTI